MSIASKIIFSVFFALLNLSLKAPCSYNNVNQVNHNSEIKQHHGHGVNGQLEKLKADLLTKREASVGQGLVQDIHMIDKALGQVDKALKEVSLEQKITNSQAKLGQIRPATQKVDPEFSDRPKVISEKEAEHIRAIKSIQGKQIMPGEQFASMHGREPSNVSYMRDNINGLFDLVALKG